MILRTGRKCKWEEIEVGEVFAWNTCWMICEKSINHYRILSCTEDADIGGFGPAGICDDYISKDELYKLPLSIQRLWKEE